MERKKIVMDYGKSVIGAVILSLFVIIFIAQAFYIPSSSMRPTLEIGDRILANKLVYRFRDPKRQEIIVFHYPVQPNRKFIKRVIGIGGDKIEIRNGQVYVNDRALEENYTLGPGYGDYGPLTVPEDNYFVLGDNRNNSEDSRFWGFVPRDHLIGKAVMIFWPIQQFKLLKVR